MKTGALNRRWRRKVLFRLETLQVCACRQTPSAYRTCSGTTDSFDEADLQFRLIPFPGDRLPASHPFLKTRIIRQKLECVQSVDDSAHQIPHRIVTKIRDVQPWGFSPVRVDDHDARIVAHPGDGREFPIVVAPPISSRTRMAFSEIYELLSQIPNSLHRFSYSSQKNPFKILSSASDLTSLAQEQNSSAPFCPPQ